MIANSGRVWLHCQPMLCRAASALLALAPLVFWRGLSSAYSLPKLLLLGAGTACAAAACLRGTRPRATALDLPIGLLAAAVAASAIFSCDRWLSVAGRQGAFSQGLWGFAAVAGCWYAGSWLDVAARSALRRMLLWAGAAAAGHALLQALGADPWAIGPLPTGRAVAGIGSPVDLGAYLALLFPLALSAFWDDKRPPAERALVLLYAAGLGATGSRAAWLAAGTGACILSLASGRRSLRRAAVVVVLAAAALLTGRAALARRALTASDISRVAVWEIALRAAASRPLLGSGPATFEHAFRLHRTPRDISRMGSALQLQDHAHNGPLNALATLGVVGFAAWGFLLWRLGTALLRERESPGVLAAAAGTAGVAVVLQFDPLAVEVLATTALLCASTLSLREPEAPVWAPPALALASVLVAGAAAALSVHDARAHRAGMEADPAKAAAGYEEAQAGAPCALSYLTPLVNKLGEAFNASHDIAAKASFLERAARAGREAARCRPGDMKTRYAAGIAYLMAAQAGLADRLPLAAAELDEALALDPWHEPLLESRLDVARRSGDAAKAAELARRLEHLKSGAP